LTLAAATGLCEHCGLPLGRRDTHRVLDGEQHAFCCYGCSLAFQVQRGNSAESEATWLLIRLGLGAFLAMNIKLLSLLIYMDAFGDGDAHLLPVVNILLWALTTAMLVLAMPFARDAWEAARRGVLTADTLMTLGVLSAYLYSCVAIAQPGGQVYFDTVALLLVLFTLGRLLEANARTRAMRSLAPMLEAERRSVTTLDESGAGRKMRIGDVLPGMRLQVLPGERVPVDGEVLDGHSHLDESIVTGESRIMAKGPGSTVLSGSINHEGRLIVRATVAGNQGRWALICRAVRESLAQRSPAQRLADRVAGAFTPLVVLLAVGTVAWWMTQVPFAQALSIGLAVLVVACPCALGLAAPLATTLGIGGLLRRGSLVRGPEVLERLARTRVAAFDKTGTLTAGETRLAAICSDGEVGEDELLARVAGLESGSEHPLARSIVAAARARGLSPGEVQEQRSIPGRGLTGRCVDGEIAAGTSGLMHSLGWPIPPAFHRQIEALEHSGHTVVHAGWAGRWRGALLLDDTLLADAPGTLRALRRLGHECVLLTGDLPAAAARIATAVGADAWHAGMSPEDKRAAVERLSRTRGPVLMVGDGLNDGPVLAAADVGVAVGGATDLARETADMTLPRNGLQLLPWAVEWARSVRRTIVGNLLWAFGYNAVALALAVLGHLTPIWAAVIMAGSSLLVVANSMRLERLGRVAPADQAARGIGPWFEPSIGLNTREDTRPVDRPV
jgi:P-type Cu2+ transporter